MLGRVLSYNGTPTTHEFYFVISSKLSVGDIVSVADGDSRIIGMVEEIEAMNRLMESPEAVKDGAIASDWNVLVARVRIAGRIGKRPERNTYPPSPGMDVEMISEDDMKNFFGTGGELLIGESSGHEVRLDMEKLIQRHVGVVAMSGAGKSHFVKVLLEELLMADAPAMIVFDVHGEYTSMIGDETLNSNIRIIDGRDVRVEWKRAGEIVRAMKLTKAEMREAMKLHMDVQSMASNDKLFHIHEELSSLGIFGDRNFPSPSDIKPGRLIIIDLSSILSNRKRSAIAYFISSMVFNERRKGMVPPAFLIYEEAHNFAPEGQASDYSKLSKRIIETISREGRKFGVSVCLISQRPVRLSTTALSQCSTKVIFRMTNPYDVDHVKRSSEAISQELSAMIPGLRTGEALIMGEALRHPLFVMIRDRKAKEREDKGLRQMLEEWKAEKKKEDRKLEGFL